MFGCIFKYYTGYCTRHKDNSKNDLVLKITCAVNSNSVPEIIYVRQNDNDQNVLVFITRNHIEIFLFKNGRTNFKRDEILK